MSRAAPPPLVPVPFPSEAPAKAERAPVSGVALFLPAQTHDLPGMYPLDPPEATGKMGAALCHLNCREKGGQTFRGWNLKRRRRNLSLASQSASASGLQGAAESFRDSLEEHLELLTQFHKIKGTQPLNGKPKEAWLLP